MRTMKCIKLDFLKSMSMVRFMLLFLVIAGGITILSGDASPSWGALYMIFGGMCAVSYNFFQTGGAEISTLVLPVTAGNRVFGRYLYGVITMTGCALLGLMICVGTMIMRSLTVETQTGEIALVFVYLGMGYMVMAFQFTFLYLTRIRNAQVLSLVRMVPAFAMFFGMNAVMDEVRKGADSGINLELIQNLFVWCMSHPMQVAGMSMAAGLAVTLVCAVICWMSEKKRY